MIEIRGRQIWWCELLNEPFVTLFPDRIHTRCPNCNSVEPVDEVNATGWFLHHYHATVTRRGVHNELTGAVIPAGVLEQ